MKTLIRRHLPFVAGACVVLAMSAVMLKLRHDLQLERDQGQVRAALQILNQSIQDEFNQGILALRKPDADISSSSIWHRWQRDSSVGDEHHSAATGEIRILGPFAQADSSNALALGEQVRTAQGQWEWRGVAAPLPALLSGEDLTPLLRQGYRVQLINLDTGTALFSSEEGALTAPVSITLSVGSSHLALAAAPRLGWHMPLQWWTSSLLILMAVLLWLTYERRRGNILRDATEDLKQAEARRSQANLLYSKAIESVAGLESRLQIVSMYDTVTGLGNRSSLLRRIETALETMRQSSGEAMGVLAIGFEQVHHIVNSFGAEFASRVLVVAAERIEFLLPSRDLLYRIGDFQLAVVLPGIQSGTSQQLAERIVNEIEAPISLDSHTFMLHPTVGISEVMSGYEYPETLLDHANAALGAVQRDAIARYCTFDSSAAKEAVSRLQLEVDLNRAFEEGQFVLEYEPIVLPVTNAVAGFEALIRWNHPTEGKLAPGRFLHVAIQAGMSHRLNHWVMREAARQASLWRRAGYQNLFINFNLSAEAFLRPQLDAEIGEILAEFDLPGSCLVVELTETALIQDLRAAARILNRLNELGLKAWLDDFGTGYSSLSYLRALPLRGVKIDRSFVERTVLDARDFGFLKSLIDLISYLGMQSIAEGIETREQYELLSMTTCDLYQGYHFAHSMPAAQAERWMLEVGGAVKRGKIA
jgi:diguanylate cyclase (GGDEF)-like protein